MGCRSLRELHLFVGFFLGLTPQALCCHPLRGLKQLKLNRQILLRVLAEVVEHLHAF